MPPLPASDAIPAADDTRLGDAFAAAVVGFDAPLVLAVSGGGDSLALMHLAARHAAMQRAALPMVLTVDHGLRPDSGRDARKVATWAEALGLEAHILVWRDKKPTSGIEAHARAARYQLMGAWMVAHGTPVLCVGHTQDDQAETFLLRLARGSGVDGLSAMTSRAPFPHQGFTDLRVARPLLGLARADLRAFLAGIGQVWLEDPMNQDPAFERVRMRAAVSGLAAAGVSARRIAAAAAHLARAREALEQMTDTLLAQATRQAGPESAKSDILLDAAALGAAPREVGLRALAAILMAVSGSPYRPRFEALERLFDRIVAGRLGRGATLQGCRVGPAPSGMAGTFPHGADGGILWVRREDPRRFS